MVYTDFVVDILAETDCNSDLHSNWYIPRVDVISPLSREFASGRNSFRLGWPPPLPSLPSTSYCLLFVSVTKSRRFPRELDTVLLEFTSDSKYEFMVYVIVSSFE